MRKRTFDIFIWTATILFVIGVFLLPDRVPVHWGLDGGVDRYGSRYEFLILVFLPVIIYYGMFITKRIDPKKNNFQGREKTYDFLRKGLSFLFVILCGFLYYMTWNPTVDMTRVAFIFIGAVFILLGNYMPKLPQNFFVGVRTPWAISNQEVWRKTQKAGGYSFVISGILIIIWGLLGFPYVFWVVTTTTIGTAVFTCGYSYIIYKKIERK